jgi:hypothetical protein
MRTARDTTCAYEIRQAKRGQLSLTKADSFGRVNRFTEEFREPLISPLTAVSLCESLASGGAPQAPASDLYIYIKKPLSREERFRRML